MRGGCVTQNNQVPFCVLLLGLGVGLGPDVPSADESQPPTENLVSLQAPATTSTSRVGSLSGLVGSLFGISGARADILVLSD